MSSERDTRSPVDPANGWDDFGGRGPRGRALGRWDEEALMNENQERIVRRMRDQGEIPAVVPYRSPQSRATSAAKRTLISVGAALLVLVGPLILTYLNEGDFSKKTTMTLLISVAVALLSAGIQWALKYNAAVKDDASVQ